MRVELTLGTPMLFGFLLVLARVAGAFVFVPLPGMKGPLEPARVVMVLAIALALFPAWPSVAPAGGGRMIGWILGEAALGVGIGVAAAAVIEVFLIAAQTLGFQAGYAYASTIDPTSEADSTILLVFGQLAAGLLFFSLGLDREIVRLFARSLATAPPGEFVAGRRAAEALVHLGQTMFAAGLRLALPIVALLAIVDLALALLGRINAQLQLLSLAFPLKMLAGLLLLSWLVVLWPRMCGAFAAHAWDTMNALVRF